MKKWELTAALIERGRKLAENQTSDQRGQMLSKQELSLNVTNWIAAIKKPGPSTAITVSPGETFESVWSQRASEARRQLEAVRDMLENFEGVELDAPTRAWRSGLLTRVRAALARP